ncbi:minor capsid protein E (plasmid) [Shewanella sp. NFH-SH190041]|uniref:major capsid protein n=1 Tax=Shewanella sp. NFH-SH190041 TaxID=2950245 RepID=UPI0021C36E3C|nr:major capsid protein [Shewanella sp. NFH-SH190041]BDM66231.1 minor capsid protein E [Shewanella sp. NFH-SH190041]
METATLLGVMTKRKPFSQVLKNLFFPNVQYFHSKKIDLDKVKKKLRRAPFVSPMVGGQVRRHEGVSTLSVYPAYVKPKDPFEPDQTQHRLPGESYATPLTPQQRRNAIFGAMAVDQDLEIDVTEEWMCAQLLKFGKIVIESEFYPKSEVNLQRDPNNTIVLTAGTTWKDLNKDTHDLDADLTDYMSRASMPVVTMLMNQFTYAEFCQFKSVKEKLETRRGSSSRLETAAFNGQLFVKMGDYGPVEVWVYSGTFDHSDGTEELFFGDGEILFAGSGAQGTMCYGMIQDPKANYQAMERFPKVFEDDDPAGEYLMTQSAPLPVMQDPDEVVYLKAF